MQFLLLTTNRFGVLSRVASIVSSFGANIEIASVYALGSSDTSVVQLSITGSETVRQRLHRKLSRLVDVLEISSGSDGDVQFIHPVAAPKQEVSPQAGLT